MITAENAKLLTEASNQIEKEANDMLNKIECEIKLACLKGEHSVTVSAHGFANYHISEKWIQIRKKVLNTIVDSGFSLDTTGFDCANRAYFKIIWG